MNKDFTLDDFWRYLQTARSPETLRQIGQMPGMEGMTRDDIAPEAALARSEAVLRAMTPEERADRDRLDAASQERIATAAGVTTKDVADLLNQFDMVRALMNRMANMTVWQRLQAVFFRRFRPPPPPK